MGIQRKVAKKRRRNVEMANSKRVNRLPKCSQHESRAETGSAAFTLLQSEVGESFRNNLHILAAQSEAA
jgi:hypothetical protein